MHWDPLKSADRVQSREAMGALGRDGTMEPWGHEPLGRAEAAEKADEKVQREKPWSAMGREGRRGREPYGAPWSGKPWGHEPLRVRGMGP